MLPDLPHAFHQVLNSPGYTISVALTFAFSIAVKTRVLVTESGVFFRSPPVRDSSRLGAIVERSRLINLLHRNSFLDFLDIRGGSKALTRDMAFILNPAHASVPGQIPERTRVEAVTSRRRSETRHHCHLRPAAPALRRRAAVQRISRRAQAPILERFL